MYNSILNPKREAAQSGQFDGMSDWQLDRLYQKTILAIEIEEKYSKVFTLKLAHLKVLKGQLRSEFSSRGIACL